MNQKQTFDQYLQNNLTKTDYDNLHTKLKISKRRCTTIKNEPEKGTILEATNIASIIGMTTKELVDDYGFGVEGINVGDYKKLSTNEKTD